MLRAPLPRIRDTRVLADLGLIDEVVHKVWSRAGSSSGIAQRDMIAEFDHAVLREDTPSRSSCSASSTSSRVCARRLRRLPDRSRRGRSTVRKALDIEFTGYTWPAFHRSHHTVHFEPSAAVLSQLLFRPASGQTVQGRWRGWQGLWRAVFRRAMKSDEECGRRGAQQRLRVFFRSGDRTASFTAPLQSAPARSHDVSQGGCSHG